MYQLYLIIFTSVGTKTALRFKKKAYIDPPPNTPKALAMLKEKMSNGSIYYLEKKNTHTRTRAHTYILY